MKISQREAQRMRKELRSLHELEAERQRLWSSEYPGINIARGGADAALIARIETARRLGHYVVVTTEGLNVLYYAPAKGT